MLSIVTTVLEIGGLIAVLVALAIAAALVAPAPWSLPAALGVLGVGMVALSYLLLRRGKR